MCSSHVAITYPHSYRYTYRCGDCNTYSYSHSNGCAQALPHAKAASDTTAMLERSLLLLAVLVFIDDLLHKIDAISAHGVHLA